LRVVVNVAAMSRVAALMVAEPPVAPRLEALFTMVVPPLSVEPPE